ISPMGTTSCADAPDSDCNTTWAGGAKVVAQEELLFNLHGAPASHVFDHSRFSLSVQVPIGSRLHAETGYMHVNRLPLQQTELQKEHNMFLHITIDFTSIDKI